MRFGLFYELQLPRPWDGDSERRVINEALEQIELADRLGFDCAWAVEHHFLEEYSHSSAPEVLLAAASQRTSRIRLGHGVVQLPAPVNHPARVAERVATLDLVSGGRVELGTGESSSAAELSGFGIRRADKREQWADALDALTRMFVEVPFRGWDSRWLRMPPRNVVPKPLQVPHPPLWVACSRRDTIHLAARRGVGALSFSFAEPEDAARWVSEYYGILGSEDCVPAGFAVNPNLAIVLPMLCHHDESTALERGMPGARFFGHALGHYYGMGRHEPGVTDIAAAFRARHQGRDGGEDPPGSVSSDASRSTPSRRPSLGSRLVREATGSPRGAIGTPDQVRSLLERYEQAGVDQAIFVMQAGDTRHEDICASLELFAREVLPGFRTRRDELEEGKRRRLQPVVQAALARRSPPRTEPERHVIDERAELARHAPMPESGLRASGLVRGASRRARRAARSTTTAALRRLVRDRDDAQLDRALSSAATQRALMLVLTRAVEPRRAGGWRGEIAWELTTSAETRTWTLVVDDGRTHLEAGGRPSAALTLRMPAAALARAAAGELAPGQLGARPDVDATGDLGVLQRLGEMFGAASPY